MAQYPDLIERVLLRTDLLQKLCPTEPLNWDLVLRIREADEAAFAAPAKPTSTALLRGALFYAVDALDEGHRHFQDDPSDLGSYWHGMMHRREGDFDNARYWFRRAGRLAFYPKLHDAIREHSPLLTRQPTWDPYLFTGECEQARYGAETEAELAKVQLAEFEVILDYTWRQLVDPKGSPA